MFKEQELREMIASVFCIVKADSWKTVHKTGQLQRVKACYTMQYEGLLYHASPHMPYNT